MDPISISIIVTVLSLGTVLLFLFKADFAKSKRVRTSSQCESNMANTSKKTKSKASPNSHSEVSSVKQQNSSPNSRAKLSAAQASDNHSRPAKASPAAEAEKKSAHQNIPDLIVGHETKPVKQQQPAPNKLTTKKKQDSKPVKLATEFELSLDELDSSIAMDIFNQASAKHSLAGNNNSRSKRHSFALFEEESLHRGGGSTSPSYSSEQLFTMIAASNLSRDEVELAVEMLLNKIDSGDSDWKKPKSDPVERLKNQLRDTEHLLSIEVQNHDQTRARLVELKSQLQNERQSSAKFEEELAKLRKELSIADLALDQSRADSSRVQLVLKQRDEEGSKVISRLEQEKIQLQTTILANESARGGDYETLRAKFEEKLVQLQRYELNQAKMNEKIAEFESKLCQADRMVDEMRVNKQHDDYEASAKISELKSDRIQLDKALKDQMTRFKEISEANNLLGKTINELRLINTRQDEMLKQMTEERQVHEASMKRTLQEMELELRELQQKLYANTVPSQHQENEKICRANPQTGEREQRLISEMNQLREALADLFPEANSNGKTNDWVQGYLIALKQLSKTLDELREPNNNIDANHHESLGLKRSTPTKATSSPRKDTPSPTNNGRSSRASTYHGHKNEDKKLQETKLLETTEYQTLDTDKKVLISGGDTE